MAALGVDGLRSRLGERFRILTAGHRLALRRHQTLRAALDWSYGLLSHAERAVVSTPWRLRRQLRLSRAPSRSWWINAIARGIAHSRAIGDRRGVFQGLAMQVYRLAKLGRCEEAERAAAEMAALYEPGWPPVLLAQMLAYRAHLHALRGRHEQAWADKLRALQEYQRMGDTLSVQIAQANLADLALALGDVDDAVRRGRDAVAALRADPASLRARGGITIANLSAALERNGQLDEAWQLAREAIPLLQRQGVLDTFIDHLALLALRRSRPADAARLIGRSDAQAARTGDRRDGNEQWAHDATLEELRRSMSQRELDNLLREGGALTEDEAVRIATTEERLAQQ